MPIVRVWSVQALFLINKKVGEEARLQVMHPRNCPKRYVIRGVYQLLKVNPKTGEIAC